MKEKAKICLNVKWSPPHDGWVCLNTDGAASQSKCRAGCGGVVRCQDGQQIVGFSKFLENTNAYVAELWGVSEGLCLVKDRGFTHIQVQLDSQVVVNSILGKGTGSASGWSLVKKIRRLLQSNQEVKILHVYREANKCAYVRANMG